MERPDEIINDLKQLLHQIEQNPLIPGVNDREYDELIDQLGSYSACEVFAELLSWIDELEKESCKLSNLPS